MTEIKKAWDEVGDAFESLALKLKLHVEESSAATTEGVKQTIDLVADSIKRATDALGNAVADEAVKTDAQRVSTAIAAAVTATFSEVTDRVRSS